MSEHSEVEYIAPRNAVVLTNQEWEDENVTRSDFGDIAPGTEEVVIRAASFKDEVRLGLYGFGLSEHTGDINNDNADESIIEYRVERRDEKGGSWKEIPGLRTVYPHGEVGNVFEPFEETIGPSYGFRLVYRNRSNNYTNQFTVNARDIGAQMNLVTERGSDF